MMSSEQAPHRFAFVFGMASGHINPSFPLARSLVERGHEVHYLSREQMQPAIEDTGAVFHNEIEVESELYDGRVPDLFGATEALKKEFGLEADSMMIGWSKLHYIMQEMQLPGLVRWLKQLQPRAVVYCPLISREAALGAEACGIPSIALLTTAGPGSMAKTMKEMLGMMQLTLEDMEQAQQGFPPHHEAVKRLNETYGLNLKPEEALRPIGKLDALERSRLTLVTTSEDLQDPMEPELEAYYAEKNIAFAAVGPLLDKEGAKRAAGHKFRDADSADAGPSPQVQEHHDDSDIDVVALVRSARAAGRRVVLASMGTVITGDSPDWGWEAKPLAEDGLPRGLTGRELCQAGWGGVFDAFGTTAAVEGPLLVMSLGPQPNALGDLRAPPNAICMPVVPQVDILQAGVDLFLTHGGQNSFTEALSAAVPLVVCPGFADQPVNARKAADLGVGLKVDRPQPRAGEEAEAAALYRAEVAAALCRVGVDPAFKEAAQRRAANLKKAGGVPRAVRLILEIAGLPESEAAREMAKELLAAEDAAKAAEAESPRRNALFAGA